MAIKISDIERLLCGPAIGDLDGLAPRPTDDPWSLQLPDLSSLPAGRQPWRSLRVCIATEDIAGPVRNGGIGTTYAHLAEMLAQMGHDSTILYLKGAQVESGTIDHWVAHYAERGVRFVPVPDFAAADGFHSHADRWMRSPYNMMRWLQENPCDVVHVSEWRGCGYLSLSAKRQGVAFADTLFLVKTSSPWMWNRLYGAEALDRLDDLAKTHAERRSVELADMVIGGSVHLLRWMKSQGYRLPDGRAFVQPNVVTFDNLHGLLGRRPIERGRRMPFDEIVFFGRLEGRKGLFVFCQAIERLIRLGAPLPPKITFLGKEGRRLTSRPDLSVLEYIAQTTAGWPTEVAAITDLQQYEALKYLLDGPRLAVMPSVIENSSMAVYEAAILGIPCIASDVGGNSELVNESDWPQIFCDPHPLSLGDKLAEAIQFGGYVPTPSFDNDANLDTWRRFHDALARGLCEDLLERADPFRPRLASSARPARSAGPPIPAASRPESSNPLGGLSRLFRSGASDDGDDQAFVRHLAARAQKRAQGPLEAPEPKPASLVQRGAPEISVCIYAPGAFGLLRQTLASLTDQTFAPIDVTIAIDAERPEQLAEIEVALEAFDVECVLVEAFDLDAGAALNRAAEAAQGGLVLFLWEGAVIHRDALATLVDVVVRCDADVLTYMHRAERMTDGPVTAPPGALCAQLMTGVSDAFFRQDVPPAPVAVTRAGFARLGGFTEDYRVLGHEAELMAKAQILGLACETVLMELGAAVGPSARWIAARGYDLPASRFRVIRPLLAAAPLAIREALLMAKGLQARASAPASAAVRSKTGGEGLEEPFSRMMQAILTGNGRRRGVPTARAD